MSKRAKTLIAVAVAVVILAGALVGVMLLPGSEPPVTTEPQTETGIEPVDESVTLLDKSKDADGNAVTTPVVAVHTDLKDGTVDLGLNDNGALCALRYKDLPLNTVASDNVSATLATITATKEIGIPENYDDFGFNDLLMTVRATYHDGTTFAYEVGSANPSKEQYYIREVGKREIYLVAASYAVYPGMTELGYISTSLITAPVAEADTNTVKNTVLMRDMTLSGSVRKFPFSFQTPALDDEDYSSYAYKVTSPHLHGCTYASGVSVGSFTSLSAAIAAIPHPTAAEKKACGFDDPYSVAKLHLAVRALETIPATSEDGKSETTMRFYNVQEHTVTVGMQDPNTGYFLVMVDNIDVIYYVDGTALAAWLTMQYDEFVDPLLFAVSIDLVDKVVVKAPGAADSVYTVVHTPEEEIDDEIDNAFRVTYNGTEKPFERNDDFRLLYMKAMSLERYSAVPTDYSTADADLVMRYTLYTGGKSEPTADVSFYRQSANLYTCKTGNGEIYSVKASLVRDFLKYTEMYNAGTPLPEE